MKLFNKLTNTEISMIVAYDSQQGIGANNALLWHIPSDMNWFKKETTNHIVVMGYNTYKDLCKYTKGKGLPNRINIVITKNNSHLVDPPCFTINDISQLEPLLLSKSFLQTSSQYFDLNKDKIYIIGGSQIYQHFLPYADELVITEIKHKYDTTIFFPTFDKTLWKRTFLSIEENSLDKKNNIYIDLFYTKLKKIS